MSPNKLPYFEKVQSHAQKEFLKAHNNCVLCGAALELLHVRLDQELQILEEAHCPDCDRKARDRKYTLN